MHEVSESINKLDRNLGNVPTGKLVDLTSNSLQRGHVSDHYSEEAIQHVCS